MEKRNLENANELLKLINETEKELAAWGFSKRWCEDSVKTSGDKNGTILVELRNIDFEIVKTLTTSMLQKKLELLQKEFKEL